MQEYIGYVKLGYNVKRNEREKKHKKRAKSRKKKEGGSTTRKTEARAIRSREIRNDTHPMTRDKRIDGAARRRLVIKLCDFLA